LALIDQLLNLKNQALALINEVENRSELNQLKVQYLGRKGSINQILKQIPRLGAEERTRLGKQANDIKTAIEQALDAKATQLTQPQTSAWLDVTIPGKKPALGHLHPVTLAIEEISHIFDHLGFTRVRYPEVDWDWYVFEALNMPEDHPARDEWETIFVEAPPHPRLGQLVLTTHTSNGQVREMQRRKTPPIRMLNIGKCYRRQHDRTHTVMFHQFEGLVIDKNIGIPHLKGTLDYFAREFYGPQAKSRIRPFHFRFTEPSFEVDFSCSLCHGRGCVYCKSGWHEVGGAGLVHPHVLKAGGIDPQKYSGFAFGWGVERAYTLKPGLQLDDIRLLYSNNLDFLNQF
jgi:phenylalanyl-tRNA synthetase alpha chain